MQKKLVYTSLVGAVLSGIALYLAFRNVPFGDLIVYMGSIDVIPLALSVAAVLLSFALRAVRWQLILKASYPVGFWRAYHPLMIGFMLNCILPGRIGEMARPVILKKREKVPFSTGLATVVAERVFDFSLIISLLALTLMTVQIDPELDLAFGSYHLNRQTLIDIGLKLVWMSVVLIAGIVAITIPPIRRYFQRVILKLPDWFSFGSRPLRATLASRVCEPLANMVAHVAAGFKLLQSPRSLGLCLLMTLLIWGFQALSYYTMAQGSPGIGLSFLEMCAVMVCIGLFIALPSVPGFWGVWEAGSIFALTLFGIAQSDAAGFALANHAVQMFPVIIAGLFSALYTGVSLRQIVRSRS